MNEMNFWYIFFCREILYNTQKFSGWLNKQFHYYSLEFFFENGMVKIPENSKNIQMYWEKLMNLLNTKKKNFTCLFIGRFAILNNFLVLFFSEINVLDVFNMIDFF